MSGLDLNTYYGKVSKSARIFNRLDLEEIREGIEVAQMQFNRDHKDISNVHLKDGNLDIPSIRLKKRKEPIEYVIEEETDKDKNENREERGSEGEER